MVAESSSLISDLSSRFPLTVPIPTPLSHPHLITSVDLATEEDLLNNSENLRSWLSYIGQIKDRISKNLPEPAETPSPEDELLGPLSSHVAREGLQQLVCLYERALAIFPTSYKLWKSYMLTRQAYVMGELTEDARKARQQQAKRGAAWKTNAKDQLDGADEANQWSGGLDGVVGYEEWRSMFATGERMLGWLSHLPVPWLIHLSMVFHPNCPTAFKRTYARRTFDRALRTLPASLHGRIWGLYLKWAESIGGEAGERVWRRFLKAGHRSLLGDILLLTRRQVDSSLTERHITYLLESEPSQPLVAAKYLLSIARRAAKNLFTPSEGKSPYQLFVDFLELVESHAESVGMDEEQTLELRNAQTQPNGVNGDASEENGEDGEAKEAPKIPLIEPASVEGRLMRIAGPPIPLAGQQAQIIRPANQKNSKAAPVTEVEIYDEDTDPSNSRLLDVEGVVHKDGLQVYKDQAGRLWTGLATYWIKRGEFERATSTFEKGLAAVVTIRDFTQIFDAYAEFSETIISTLMDAVGDEDNLADEEFDVEETEAELDQRMKDFEELMDRRPFLINEVLLRRNPNEVVEWEKRVALWADNDEKVVETYLKALETINPRKATGPLYPLYVNFAKFYEEGGSKDEESGEPRNEPDIDQARKIFEKGTQVPYKAVDELAEIWCEWSEMELRNE